MDRRGAHELVIVVVDEQVIVLARGDRRRQQANAHDLARHEAHLKIIVIREAPDLTPVDPKTRGTRWRGQHLRRTKTVIGLNLLDLHGICEHAWRFAANLDAAKRVLDRSYF